MGENESTTITAKHNGARKELCRIHVKASSDEGLKIFLQSNHNFNFLADLGERKMKIGGVECYVPRNGDGSNIPGVPGVFRCSKTDFFADGQPNLSLLLARKLKEGVTFNFGVFPIGEDKVTEFLQQFKLQVKTLYLTYLKPVNQEMVITTETVERSVED
jgi:hypothetical protein